MAIRNIRTPALNVHSTKQTDPYEQIAHLYYYEYKTLTLDLNLYLHLLRDLSGHVLEIGCGTGRIACALAEEGYAVTGIDSSREMLTYAQKHAVKLKERKEIRLNFVRADMRDFHFIKQFEAVLIPFSAFAFLTGTEDQERCLGSIRRHLAPGGMLIIDLFAPDFSKWGIEEGERRYVSSFFARLDDDQVLVNKFEQIRRDPYAGRLDIHFTYEIPYYLMEKQTVTTSITLSMFTKREIELLLEKNGFIVEDVFGDYKMGGYSKKSPRLIFIASKDE